MGATGSSRSDRYGSDFGKPGDQARSTARCSAHDSASTPACAHRLIDGAASTNQATINALVGGRIAADGIAGTATGDFSTSGISISNVTGEQTTGQITAKYVLQGPWNTAAITKPDGSPFVLNETIVHGGTTWTVSRVDADASGIWEIHFIGQSVTFSGDTVVSIPPAIYSGTFTPGTPTPRNPVAGQVAVAAAAVNNGEGVQNSSGYPA